MRFGYCTSMLATTPDGTGVEWLETVKNAGFDYVDLPLAQLCAMEDSAFYRAVGMLEKLDLRCEASNNFMPGTVKITGPNVDPQSIERYLEKASGRIKLLNQSVLCVGSSGSRNVPEGFPREKAYEQLKTFFKRLSDWLPSTTIAVIEPLRTEESNILNAALEAYELMKAADRENVRMLVDYYHIVYVDDPFASITTIGKDLRHTHFAGIRGRKIPLFFNETMIMFFETLKKAGYDARLSVEAYSDKPEEELPIICSNLKEYFHTT